MAGRYGIEEGLHPGCGPWGCEVGREEVVTAAVWPLHVACTSCLLGAEADLLLYLMPSSLDREEVVSSLALASPPTHRQLPPHLCGAGLVLPQLIPTLCSPSDWSLPDVLPNSLSPAPWLRRAEARGHHQLWPGTEVSSHTRQPVSSKASLPLCSLLSPVLVFPGQRDIGGTPAPYHIPRRHPGHPEDLCRLRPPGCSCGQQLAKPQHPAEVEEAPREWLVEGGPPRPPWATAISSCGEDSQPRLFTRRQQACV